MLRDSDGEMDSEEEALQDSRGERHQPSQDDSVLISYLSPNRPDIAQEAARIHLDSSLNPEDVYALPIALA